MFRRQFVFGSLCTGLFSGTTVNAQSCGGGRVIFLFSPSQSRAANDLVSGALEAAGNPEVLRCNPEINFIDVDNSFGSMLAEVERASRTYENAVVVGAFGEGTGLKYAAQFPNVAYLNVLPSGSNFGSNSENYYTLNTDAAGSWEIDYHQQGIAALDLSLAMASSFSQTGNGSVHYRPFETGIFGGQLDGIINSYGIDPYTNEVQVIGRRN